MLGTGFTVIGVEPGLVDDRDGKGGVSMTGIGVEPGLVDDRAGKGGVSITAIGVGPGLVYDTDAKGSGAIKVGGGCDEMRGRVRFCGIAMAVSMTAIGVATSVKLICLFSCLANSPTTVIVVVV